LANAAQAAGALGEQAQAAPEWKPPLAGRTHSEIFITQVRRRAEVKMGVEGVWNLRRGMIASFVLERVVNPTRTDPADINRADCAVMAYAVELLQEHRQQGGRLTLHLPLTYASAATRQSRERVLSVLAPVRDLLRSTILFELTDLDPGVPPSRLIEVVALLKPFCMGVLARVHPTRKALAAVKACGLQGVALDGLGLERPPAGLGGFLRAFTEAAQGGSPNILVHNLANAQLIDLAAKAGMTHGSA